MDSSISEYHIWSSYNVNQLVEILKIISTILRYRLGTPEAIMIEETIYDLNNTDIPRPPPNTPPSKTRTRFGKVTKDWKNLE